MSAKQIRNCYRFQRVCAVHLLRWLQGVTPCADQQQQKFGLFPNPSLFNAFVVFKRWKGRAGKYTKSVHCVTGISLPPSSLSVCLYLIHARAPPLLIILNVICYIVILLGRVLCVYRQNRTSRFKYVFLPYRTDNVLSSTLGHCEYKYRLVC